MNSKSNKLFVFYQHDLVDMSIFGNAFQDHLLKYSQNKLGYALLRFRELEQVDV